MTNYISDEHLSLLHKQDVHHISNTKSDFEHRQEVFEYFND